MDPSYKSDLNEYISQCKSRLENVLQKLGWTEAATLKDYNANSLASASRHVMKNLCSTPKSSFPESCANENSVVLETPALQTLLENNMLKAPDYFNELQGNFSREQKLKLYEHAIKNTRKVENNLLDKDTEGEIPLADILAQKKRDEKRKKRRFRKSKPTHVEEVRCLVDLQMQALEQFLANKIKALEPSTLPSGSNTDDHGNENKFLEERRLLKDNGRKKYHGEIYTKHYDIKSSHRNVSKEALSAKRRSKYVISDAREREFQSRGRERRRSTSEDICQERKKHKRHKSETERRKHNRHNRSRSKKVSKEKNYHASRRSTSRDRKFSMETKTSQGNYEREENDSYKKYASGSELTSYSKHSKEQQDNYKYHRNHRSSPESYRKKHKIRRKQD